MTDKTPAHRKAELPPVKCETTYTETADAKTGDKQKQKSPPNVEKKD